MTRQGAGRASTCPPPHQDSDELRLWRQPGAPERQAGAPEPQDGTPERQVGAPELQAGSPEPQGSESAEEGGKGQYVCFHVTCSKGTCIRSLCRDLAEAVGTLGHLTALRREAIGSLSVEDAFSIEDVTRMAAGAEGAAGCAGRGHGVVRLGAARGEYSTLIQYLDKVP